MKYFECTYDWVESAAPKNRDRLRAEKFEHVVGILRGGTMPAFMAAQMTDASLSFLAFSRDDKRVTWSGQAPPKKSKVLLVDDISGEGHTLSASKQFLE